MASFRSSSLDSEWRQDILSRLQVRNRNQCQCFQDLILQHNRLFENADTLQNRNFQLTIQNEKLREENLELQSKTDLSSGRPNDRATLALEQKLFRLQEELTELHRRKGENAQQLIDLRNSLQEKEKEVIVKELRIKELEICIQTLRDNQRYLEQTAKELELTNQMLKDEHQALQIAFSGLEEQVRRLKEENQELIERWMKQKAKDADRLNDENEHMLRKRQIKLQKELADAAREPVQIALPEKYYPDFDITLKISLPSKVMTKFDAHDNEVHAIKWGPSSKLIASGGADRKVKLWELVKGACELRGELTGSNAAVMSIDFDTEESLILGASNDFASRVWTVADLRLRHSLTGHSGKVLAAKFFGESTRVVSGSHDRTLKIWDLRSKACVRTIFAGSSCNDLVTDRSGTTIISGHFDKRIRFWDSRSESSANEVSLQGKVTSLDLSADGFSLLSCSRDDILKVLDLRMNQVIGTYSADNFKVSCDWNRAVFSPDGQYVAVGSHDGTIFIWNTTDGKLEKTLKEHNCLVGACSWQPKGSNLVSCDRNRKIIVWSDM